MAVSNQKSNRTFPSFFRLLSLRLGLWSRLLYVFQVGLHERARCWILNDVVTVSKFCRLCSTWFHRLGYWDAVTCEQRFVIWNPWRFYWRFLKGLATIRVMTSTVGFQTSTSTWTDPYWSSQAYLVTYTLHIHIHIHIHWSLAWGQFEERPSQYQNKCHANDHDNGYNDLWRHQWRLVVSSICRAFRVKGDSSKASSWSRRGQENTKLGFS